MRRSMISIAVLAAAVSGFVSGAFRSAGVFNAAHRLTLNEPPPTRGKGNRAARRANLKRKNQIRTRRTRARKR